MSDRPYKIYRYAAVGRCLYDTQVTQEAAEASAQTARREHPDQQIEIVNAEQPPRIDEQSDQEKLQAIFNDLLALQDRTDQIPLTTALDAVGLALRITGAVGSLPTRGGE